MPSPTHHELLAHLVATKTLFDEDRSHQTERTLLPIRKLLELLSNGSLQGDR